MGLTSGTRLGVYEVTGRLGAGGMGEVYRARDTKLHRDVALKALPEAFATDPERLARFEREAHVLASLNHPHIAAIYGLEEAGGTRAIVMELVEGPTLADRIAGGPIPADEALPIARQIAEALEAAHEQGIIHRDLKPANIKVRDDGTVKVLDFGLAKAMEPAAVGRDFSPASPTITTPAVTRAGMILGTAAYMSPEQARGKEVDKRADIWAFAAVVFEMLTGQRAFPGEDLTDTLAAVVKLDPAWDTLGRDVPARVSQVLRLCLQKDPRQRVQAIGDVRLALAGAFETAATGATATDLSSPRHGLAWVASLIASIAAAVLAVPAVRHLREAPPPLAGETRVDIATPATNDSGSFALSPDGRQIVFVASGAGASRLWLRPLSDTSAEPLDGTEGASSPFWSSDSRSVGFFADGQLKRLDLATGASQTLAKAAGARGGTWNADDEILFALSSGPLLRVPAAGGQPVAVTILDRQASHRMPSFLPDGRHFLFFATGATEDTAGIYLGVLDSPVTQRLTAAQTAGVYLPSGWLLWLRAGTLVAQQLSLERMALTGDTITVADRLMIDEQMASPAASVSSTGLVAYRLGSASRRQLTWFDRSGIARGTVGEPDTSLVNPRVAPDGRRVAVGRTVQGNWDIWLLDGTRRTRFTFDAALEQFPVWSPDGREVVFQSDRKGMGRDIFHKASSGGGAEEPLVESGQITIASDWSADGRFMLYYSLDPQSARDLWVLPMEGDRKPWALLKSPFDERWAQFSPDSRFVAYMSDESGRTEIYVRPFAPISGAAATIAGQWQVSAAGGLFPRWRPDGKELYYIGPNGEVMVVPITTTGTTTLQPGVPLALFRTRIVGGGVDSTSGPQYDVAPDGRFLINTLLDDVSTPITLLMNWKPEAKK